MSHFLRSIPSPSSGTISIGPLSIHAYGLMIAFGVVAGVMLAGRRLEARRAGTRDDESAVAVWAVVAGVIGARLYHVATDWSSFSGNLGRIFEIWKGGLGIPGGLLLGIPVGLWVTKRRGIDVAVMATCNAPAIALAQSIGRWGNWFNPELFGKPTTLPWGLEVSADKAMAAGYPPGTLFHPTFLYESLWTLGLCFVLLWIDRKWCPRPGKLMAMYLIGYGIGRFWIEGLRIDPAHHVGGLRWNQWIAVVMVVLGVFYLWLRRGNPEPVDDEPATDEQHDDEPVADEPGDDEQHDDEPVDDEQHDEEPGLGDEYGDGDE